MSKSTSQSQSLPKTCRALILSQPGQPPKVETVPIPEVIHGSVIIKVLAAAVDALTPVIISGKIPGLHQPAGFAPGSKAIGRIAATGPDTTSFEVGQLVYLDSFVRGRDNPDVLFLLGLGVFGDSPQALKLMEDVWRNGFFAEYARAPLENVYALDEKRLLGSPGEGGLGYSLGDLLLFPRHLVAYGGLRGINVKAGETIIIAPATGTYSGAAVEVASALGARVIAASRNLEKMKGIVSNFERVNTVKLEGDVEKDLASLKQFGPVDAFLDISPPQAQDSTHVRSCFLALKPYGRASLMGQISPDIPVPYIYATIMNLTIRGQYMYEREDIRGIIKLIETGVLKLGSRVGHQVVGKYPLEEWAEAFDQAGKNADAGKIVFFTIAA